MYKPCRCFGKRIWKNAMIYNHQSECSGCFLLLKHGVMPRSIVHLFCLPFIYSSQANCRYGLFAPSSLHFMKALQSLDYKTNISQTEMIDHLARDVQILVLCSLSTMYNKGLGTTQDLKYKVHLYLCLYKSETSLFPPLFPHTPKNQRLYI